MIINKSKSLPSNQKKGSCFLGRFLFVAIFLFAAPQLYAQGDFFKNTSLIRIFERLEKDYKVNFSYNVALIKSRKISFFQLSNKSIEWDLVALLRDEKLGFDRLGEDIIIKQVPANYYNKYRQKACGFIIDADEGLPLGHASISIANTTFGQTADSLGRFSIEYPMVETDYLEINFIGYETKRLKLSFFLNQPCKTIFLNPINMEVAQVIVREDYNLYAGIKISNIDPDVVIIRPDKMMGTGGIEPQDVFGTLQQIPGVSSSDESATSLNVRGGSSGQNLVLFDNIPLYHYGHIFGKVSAFNNDLIEEVRFNKGGFSSEQGGRVASIIDIKSTNKIPKEMGIKAKVGLLSFGISGEVPFAKNKAALTVGYRKSIFEKSALSQLLLNQVFQGTRVVEDVALGDTLQNPVLYKPYNTFYDFFAKAIWKPTDEDIIGVTALKMGDRMKYQFSNCASDDCYKSQDNLKLDNIGYQASWKHDWRPNFSSSLLYAFSGFNKSYDFVDNAVDSLAVVNSERNSILDKSFQFNNQWVRNGVQVNFGAQHKKVHGIIDNRKHTLLVQDTLSDNSLGQTNTLFLDYRHDLGDMFHLFIGGRLSSYDLLDKPVFLEPRFSVSSNPNQYLKIKMSGGIYYQTMNKLLSADGLSERDELWVLSKDVKGNNSNSTLFVPQKSTQVSVGIAYRRSGWQLNMDVYDKQITGISSNTVDLQVVNFGELGKMKASGLEIGVQKWSENYFSVLSYTRGFATYDFPSYSKPIIASYQQKHQLSVLQGVKYKNFSATMNWKLKSGSPYSEKIGIQVDTVGLNNFNYAIEYAGINQSMLSNYSRVDLALSYKHLFKWGLATVNFSALNILNKRNVLNRRYELIVSELAKQGKEDPLLFLQERNGLFFTPNVSLLFEFGFWGEQ